MWGLESWSRGSHRKSNVVPPVATSKKKNWEFWCEPFQGKTWWKHMDYHMDTFWMDDIGRHQGHWTTSPGHKAASRLAMTCHDRHLAGELLVAAWSTLPWDEGRPYGREWSFYASGHWAIGWSLESSKLNRFLFGEQIKAAFKQTWDGLPSKFLVVSITSETILIRVVPWINWECCEVAETQLHP